MQTTTRPNPRVTLPAQPRHDGYHGIHKALRLFMTDTLVRVGRTDPADTAEVSTTLAQLGDLLAMCELHVHDENEFIHPALERALPGSAHSAAREHGQHLDAIADLRDLAGLIADTQGAARAAAFARLYRALTLFVAENFEHMHVEETDHNAVLWAHYSDAELLAIEHDLVASIPPQAMMRALRWFIPALSAPERAQMLGGMQRGMPAPVFDAVLDIARQTLATPDYAKLARTLGIAPAPGLVQA